MSSSPSFPIGLALGRPAISDTNLIYADNPDGGIIGAVHSWNLETQLENWHYSMSGICIGGAAVGNNSVYAGGMDGVLHAMDLSTGTLKWTYSTALAIWGTPLVTTGGLVLVTDVGGSLSAINTSGSLIWTCKPPMSSIPANTTSPILSDSGQIVVYGIRFMNSPSGDLTSVVAGVRLTDGALLWQASVPLIAGDLFHGADLCTGGGQAYVPCCDRTVHALDVTTGLSNWVYSTLDDVRATPACDGTTVYFGDISGNFCAVNAQTGTMQWSMPVGFVSTGVVISDGYLYFGIEGEKPQFGRMLCADPSQQGAGAYTLQAPTQGSLCTPTVQDQIAYCAVALLVAQGNNMCTLPFNWDLSTMSVQRSTVALMDMAANLGSYHSVVTVQNQQKVAQPNLPLTVWASGPMTLLVGGATYQVNVNQPATINSDANGQLAFTAQSSSSPLPKVLISAPSWPAPAAFIICPPPSGVQAERRTDDQLWSVETAGSAGHASPVMGNGALYYTDDIPSQNGPPHGTLHSVDIQTGQENWRFSTAGPLDVTPLWAGDRVYCGGSDGLLHALDARSGQQAWAFSAQARVITHPVLAAGLILVGQSGGQLYAVNSSGDQVWQWSAGPAALTSPTVAGERVLLAASGAQTGTATAYCLDLKTGTAQWSHPLTSTAHAAPCAGAGLVFFGCDDGGVIALDLADGVQRWRFQTGSTIMCSPAVAGDTLYCGSGDGNFYGLDTATGALLWVLPCAGAVRTNITITDGIALCATMAQRNVAPQLYAIDLSSQGANVATYSLPTAISAAPVSRNGILYLWAGDMLGGTLQAIAPLSAQHSTSTGDTSRRLLVDSQLMVDDYDFSGGQPTPLGSVYRVSLRLFDGQGCPRPYEPIKFGATAPVTVSAGGQTYSLSPTATAWLPADQAGELTLSIPAISLTVPTLTLWTSDMPLGAQILINPANAVVQKLAQLQSGALLAARAFNGQPILLPAYQSQATAENLAEAIRATLGPSSAWQVTITNSAVTFDPGTLSSATVTPSPGSYADYLRDVIDGAGQISTVAWSGYGSATIQTATNVYVFTVTDQATSAMVSLGMLKGVVVTPAAIFEWLSFQFDWKAVVQTHNEILAAARSNLANLQAWVSDQAGSGCASAHASIEQWQGQIAASLDQAAAQAGSTTLGAVLQANGFPSYFQAGGAAAYAYSQWLPSRLWSAALPATSGSPLVGAFAQFWSTAAEELGRPPFATLPFEVQIAFRQLERRCISSGAFLGTTLAQVLAPGRNAATDLLRFCDATVEGYVGLLETGLGLMDSLLTAPVEVPYLSDLYQCLTGEQASLLGLCALTVAVPTSLALQAVPGAQGPAVAATFASYYNGILDTAVAPTPASPAPGPVALSAAMGWLAQCLTATGSGTTALQEAVGLAPLFWRTVLWQGQNDPPLPGWEGAIPWLYSGFGNLYLTLAVASEAPTALVGSICLSLPTLTTPLMPGGDPDGRGLYRAVSTGDLVVTGLSATWLPS